MLETATQAAARARAILRDRFHTTVRIETKGVANFVTQADLDSEQVIVETIQQSFPSHAIISEESHSDRADAAELWIVDPMDGTSNFMHGIPQFAISIAFYRNGIPELGIVHNPIHDDWYITVVEQGAWLNGKQQKVAEHMRLDESMLACGFYYDRGRMMQATLDTVGDFFRCRIHGMRRFGAAALDLCMLGCGCFGVFFEYQLHPWDYAAGQLFLSEAGGKATDCDGQRLPLNRASSICATNSHLHEQAMTIIAPHWKNLNQETSP
jgi:myo-inositol-1(or 4)-monophosphatase